MRLNNLRILAIKNAKFSGYCFYMKPNISWNFQFYISVPLIIKFINSIKGTVMQIM